MEQRKLSDARYGAYKILYAVYAENAYINLALSEVLSKLQMRAQDKTLASAIAYGCVKYQIYLDYIIEKFSSIKLKKLSVNVLVLLRMGVFQIMKLDRVPDSAAVDECVRLAGKLAYKSKGFVNGVLRSVVREKEKICLPEAADARLSVQYSFPLSLVQHWIAIYGEKRAETLMEALCTAPQMHVRVNTLKASVETVRTSLEEAGAIVENGKFDDALVLSGAELTALDAYKNGWITAQGAGSMTAVRALDAKRGMTVLDMCAAPGGKSVYIAQRAENQCKLQAFDVHEHKLELIDQTAARMGMMCITSKCADASVPMEILCDSADRVLVDAPCSGLGIIGKKPDIKYAWSAEKEDALAQLQLKILNTCKAYVKRGGILVYSTCTIGEKENLGVVRAFLKENPDFVLCDMADALPSGVTKDSAREGYAEFFPDTDGIDGFFVCKMMRN
ncbi:MAG: 16S rRNA (cytosine(967)-C(5))-methyltransferase RsmB [Clostridia bacterium]|nr:16S rRNA (cytosine(967)-C(5))-methyltransferase RsmB [Clostridia bacterium]